ncbi:hypothetical protein AMJ87_10955 [candidate division WOR_3 bacterium SM23_60]|uniref:Uncharacterized protein n=1 Tax=candidate division WOR_3 bacterium SM23_60 TaxID=1703780 RepID=A0A0S8G8R2_UNCW3|nr:MAG: hypothetical protein AMJ87_10955 [candidate division WOR_3 bacterium SM23_60]
MYFRKAAEGSVVGLLNFIREATCRKLIQAQVILQTLAALPFSRTWFIRTITVLHIVFLLAIHGQLYR